MRSDARYPSMMFIASLLVFGTNGVVASTIGLDGIWIVLLRSMIGAVALVAVFLVMGNRFTFHRDRRTFVLMAVSGASMGLSWMCLFEAYDSAGVGLASLEYYCGPVIVMALSPLLFGERLTARRVLGFAVVFLGIVAVGMDGVSGSADAGGLLLGAMSAVLLAVMIVTNKMAVGVRGMENPVVQLVFAFATVAAVSLVTGDAAMAVAPSDVPGILVLGLVNTALGCVLYFTSMGRIRSQTVAVCGYIEPLTAVVLAALVLGEPMGPVQVLGAAMVIGGALFCETGAVASE